MNQTIKDMLDRRSCRKFKSDAVPEELINEVILAGQYAANGKGKQATRIIAVTNKDLIERLVKDNREIGGFSENVNPFYGAPVILIVLAEKDWPNRVYDGSLVMGNLMLAAHSLGLGSIWIHRAKQEFEMDYYKNLLKEIGLEGEYEGIGHCAIGYVEGELPVAAPRKENHIFYVK